MAPVNSKNSSPQVKASPRRAKVKRTPVVRPERNSKNVIEIFQAGEDGRFLIGVMLQSNGYGGFSKPILDAITVGDVAKYPKIGEEFFDIKCKSPLLLRKSHEQDVIIKNNPNSKYGRIAFVSYPNSEKYPDIDMNVKKEFRDLLVEIFCKEQQKNAESTFAPFQPSHCREPAGIAPFSALDKIFLDESVDHILTNYHIPEDAETPEAKYQIITKTKLDDIYTRHLDGKFSFYAIKFVGYPEGLNYQA